MSGDGLVVVCRGSLSQLYRPKLTGEIKLRERDPRDMAGLRAIRRHVPSPHHAFSAGQDGFLTLPETVRLV